MLTGEGCGRQGESFLQDAYRDDDASRTGSRLSRVLPQALPSRTNMRRDTLLSQTNDDWYVRLPDGKVLPAPTTGTVRKNLKRGRIPTGSTVRRSEEDEWVTLAWTSEFADIVKRADSTPVPLNKV